MISIFIGSLKTHDELILNILYYLFMPPVYLPIKIVLYVLPVISALYGTVKIGQRLINPPSIFDSCVTKIPIDGAGDGESVSAESFLSSMHILLDDYRTWLEGEEFHRFKDLVVTMGSTTNNTTKTQRDFNEGITALKSVITKRLEYLKRHRKPLFHIIELADSIPIEPGLRGVGREVNPSHVEFVREFTTKCIEYLNIEITLFTDLQMILSTLAKVNKFERVVLESKERSDLQVPAIIAAKKNNDLEMVQAVGKKAYKDLKIVLTSRKKATRAKQQFKLLTEKFEANYSYSGTSAIMRDYYYTPFKSIAKELFSVTESYVKLHDTRVSEPYINYRYYLSFIPSYTKAAAGENPNHRDAKALKNLSKKLNKSRLKLVPAFNHPIAANNANAVASTSQSQNTNSQFVSIGQTGGGSSTVNNVALARGSRSNLPSSGNILLLQYENYQNFQSKSETELLIFKGFVLLSIGLLKIGSQLFPLKQNDKTFLKGESCSPDQNDLNENNSNY